MLQSYTLLHKTSGNKNISVLNFIKSNNLKVLLPNLVTILSFFLVTKTLHFQIIFVTLRQKLKH
jgi:hypothetical protein